MVERGAPKRFQRTGKYERALDFYISRYLESIKSGDRFLSALYLDEVARTLIMMEKKRLTFVSLEKKARELLMQKLEAKQKEDFEEDLQIMLRKRFPERFREKQYDQDEVDEKEES